MRMLVLLTLCAAACQAQEPAPKVVEVQAALHVFEGDDGKMGYRDDSDEVRIAPQFAFASEFSPEGLAWVATDDGLFWIDRTGARLAQAFAYDNGADPFVEGRARIVANGKMGFIDARGKQVVPPRFDFLGPLEAGRARFCEGCKAVSDGEHTRMEGGNWGVVDANGKVLEAATPGRPD